MKRPTLSNRNLNAGIRKLKSFLKNENEEVGKLGNSYILNKVQDAMKTKHYAKN